MTPEQIREAWLTLVAELDQARSVWGWDDPRTVAIEDAEADATALYLATNY